jgi:hypothetical protein
VGFRSVPCKIVLVQMMCVVDVGVRVSEGFVPVLVCMTFGQVERNAGSHQQRRQPKAGWRRFTQDDQRDRRSEKRSGREVEALELVTTPRSCPFFQSRRYTPEPDAFCSARQR